MEGDRMRRIARRYDMTLPERKADLWRSMTPLERSRSINCEFQCEFCGGDHILKFLVGDYVEYVEEYRGFCNRLSLFQLDPETLQIKPSSFAPLDGKRGFVTETGMGDPNGQGMRATVVIGDSSISTIECSLKLISRKT